MNQLPSLIANWISVNFDLPVMNELPDIAFVQSASISGQRYGQVSVAQRRPTVSIYDDNSRTIYLPEGGRGRTPQDTSILVHEMVHHLQSLGGLSYPCPAAREAVANHAQADWLKLFKLDLESEFRIDTLTLKVSTGCMR